MITRWREYIDLLLHAKSLNYRFLALEDWVDGHGEGAERVMLLRHDVDGRPAAATRMARIEHEIGVRSSWYFRWSTAHPRIIAQIRALDMPVGLHYDTLTRAAVKRGDGAPPTAAAIAAARAALRGEIKTFENLFGPIRSICPHGDSRVPGTRNARLTDDGMAELDVEFDGDQLTRGVPLAWLTDRADGGWKDGRHPMTVVDEGRSPILLLVHPNHWAARPAVLADRLLAAVVPDPLKTRRSRWPVVSRSPDPPLP